jgi:hypothetical protein
VKESKARKKLWYYASTIPGIGLALAGGHDVYSFHVTRRPTLSRLEHSECVTTLSPLGTLIISNTPSMCRSTTWGRSSRRTRLRPSILPPRPNPAPQQPTPRPPHPRVRRCCPEQGHLQLGSAGFTILCQRCCRRHGRPQLESLCASSATFRPTCSKQPLQGSPFTSSVILQRRGNQLQGRPGAGRAFASFGGLCQRRIVRSWMLAARSSASSFRISPFLFD